ncbi:hypothetical protein [Streptomyces sp. AF1A]|jgi:hypothetical protein|uniref:hypothetical protein n=1 Tax=Streptomyces sp. AF1A TaxID=3394350 RepID=UPI0039BD9108
MRGKGAAGLACLLLAAGPLTGCRGPADAPVGSARPTSSATSGYGAEFLAVGECSSSGTSGVTEVPCTGERAAAKVVARYDGAADDGPLCPATTDFVLHIGGRRATGEAGDGAIPQGYACMRNLAPPHPGDPGAGGGPRTVPGDCVYSSGAGQVRETACAGSGRRKPQYRITKAVARRADCPPSTVLYVQLGGRQPVGCARRL